VRPDLPVKSVSELIAYAKANPGKLNYAAVGAGNITHLSAELLKKKTGIDFLVVQYKSGGEAMNALMAGQADFAISNVTVVRPLLTSGKLRALAVTSDKRQAGFDLPTMIEAGIPDYVVQSYFGIVAPAGTPQPILDKLNAQTRAALKTPKFEGVLQKFDAAPNDETAQQFQSFIAQEAKRWKDIADVTGIKLD
jgi:tripartite-type tricarboxylate transporter receptor subunit TctC